jgi:hypothetical protein
MNRWVVSTALAATACLAGSALWGQQTAGPSRADLGFYAGGAWTTPWLETGEGTTFGIGFNPIFGGVGTFWFAPRWGVRLHGAYMPSDLPQPNPAGAVVVPDGRIHNWFYDLGLSFRPFAAPGRGGILSTGYVFLGAGAFTPNVEGGDAVRCVATYIQGGACLPYDWRDATVGQVTAGAGFRAIPITRNLGLFLEGGVHVYDSPFRIGDVWDGLPACPNEACRGNDRMALTTRLGAGLALLVRPPPVLTRTVLPPPPPPPPAPPDRPITVCVVVNGVPQYVEAFVRPQEGDTVVVTPQGIRRPLRAAHPVPPTASGRDWFVRDEPIFLDRQEYVRLGVPRVLTAEEINRIGEYQGVPLYAPRDGTRPPNVFYVPIQDGCIFQPYQRRPPLLGMDGRG